MKKISVEELQLNPMTLIANEWMLITAGDEKGYNTMTASWGHLGSIWGKHSFGMPTSVCYVRPQRYTKQFIDREDLYTLTFFPKEFHDKLMYLGSHSGRDEDKVANTALTPVFGDGYTYFEEASLTLVCRKVYQAPLIEEGFVDKSIVESHYKAKDFHDMYIGEIIEVFVKE